MLVKNSIIKLNITDMDYLGYGISHYDNHTIFVSNALIGEEVRALILKVTEKMAFAKVVEIIKRSPNRIEPSCPYFKECGGCNLLHMNYEEELKFKQSALKQTLEKMVKDINLNPIIKADNVSGYRNKISLPVGYGDFGFVTGFYQERSHRIISANSCMLEQAGSRDIVKNVLDKLNYSNIYPYNEEDNTGDLRHLVLRANHLGEFMLVFVVREDSKKVYDFVNGISISNVKSIYLNVNSKQTNVIFGDKFIKIYGVDYLEEEVLGNKFMLHPNSFFQVNYYQMIKLYQKAIEELNPSKDDVIIDAYCGTGTIGMSIAKHVKKVYGIEVVEEAIMNANKNASLNNIDNIQFILGKCEDEIFKLVQNEKIDGIILDPPRKGSDKAFLDAVISAKIPKIVYISCGPSTLARDLKCLTENGYLINSITPVDLFPRTIHVESVCSLSLREQKN